MSYNHYFKDNVYIILNCKLVLSLDVTTSSPPGVSDIGMEWDYIDVIGTDQNDHTVILWNFHGRKSSLMHFPEHPEP